MDEIDGWIIPLRLLEHILFYEPGSLFSKPVKLELTPGLADFLVGCD